VTDVKAGVWFRVSTGHQDSANQEPDVAQFVAHHGYTVAREYRVSDSAWKNGDEYAATLEQALQDAWEGKFSVLVIWSLDRLVRQGPEEALRIFRQFGERKVSIVSVKEPWLNGSPEVQKLLISFAGWMAEQESRRRSERIRAGLARRKAAGKPVGRAEGSRDKGKRRTKGYAGNQNARKKTDS
jgi:putative DNA-invertase from lambdoid prophage Rac